jgi:hypothetical protein
MKIRQVRAELLHADGQTTYMTKLIVAFRNFLKAPNKEKQFESSVESVEC